MTNIKNIIDDSILNVREVVPVPDVIIIPNQDGGGIREVGNPFAIGDDIILMYTMENKTLNQQWLYYSYCNKNEVTNPLSWIHKGKLNIDHEMEDPFLKLKNGEFILTAEDKQKPETHSICQSSSTDWNYKTNAGTWTPPITLFSPVNNGGIYSPLSFDDNGNEYEFAEERYTNVYKDINIVNAKTRKILLHYTDVFNIFSTDYIYKINYKYYQWIHSYSVAHGWAHNMAVSDNLLSGWKLLPQIIKPLGIVPIFTNKWDYLVESPGGLSLGIPKTIPKPINEENMEPKNLKFDKITRVLSCDDIPQSTRFDAYSNGGWQDDLIDCNFIRENGRIIYLNTLPKFTKPSHYDPFGGIQKIWIYSTVNGIKYKSDILKVDYNNGPDIEPDPDPEPIDPSDTVKYAKQIIEIAGKIVEINTE